MIKRVIEYLSWLIDSAKLTCSQVFDLIKFIFEISSNYIKDTIGQGGTIFLNQKFEIIDPQTSNTLLVDGKRAYFIERLYEHIQNASKLYFVIELVSCKKLIEDSCWVFEYLIGFDFFNSSLTSFSEAMSNLFSNYGKVITAIGVFTLANLANQLRKTTNEIKITQAHLIADDIVFDQIITDLIALEHEINDIRTRLNVENTLEVLNELLRRNRQLFRQFQQIETRTRQLNVNFGNQREKVENLMNQSYANEFFSRSMSLAFASKGFYSLFQQNFLKAAIDFTLSGAGIYMSKKNRENLEESKRLLIHLVENIRSSEIFFQDLNSTTDALDQQKVSLDEKIMQARIEAEVERRMNIMQLNN